MTNLERKQMYIKMIGDAHPIFLPESGMAQRAFKSMEKLSVDTLIYLYHLISPREAK